MKYFFSVLIAFLISGSSFAQQKSPPFYSNEAAAWADSVLKKISLEEKIGQLFMAAAWSNLDTSHTNRIREQITNNHIGGLIFFQGGPVRQALLTNEYQNLSRIPMLIGMDAEWGLSMRIDSTLRFPRQMTLSATGNDSTAYFMGQEIAHQCSRLGVHINFAPDADVNSNPLNPVIGSRAFSDDAATVTKRSTLYMNGLQNNRVLACAKHFPGHGDTDTDSHLALPVIHKNKSQLDSLELIPFRKLINEGAGSVMVAHIFMPEIDSAENAATTLSKKVVTGLLKEEMKFRGLVFTDALNMKGVSAFSDAGTLAVKALMAGNDVLLYSENVPAAIDSVKKAIGEKKISEEEITMRVKKILQVKYWVGLNNYKAIDTTDIYSDLNTPEASLLSRKMYESAITVLKNKSEIIPLKKLDTLSIAAVCIGDTGSNPFAEQLKMYAPVKVFSIPNNSLKSRFDALLDSLEKFNLVIAGLHGIIMNPAKNYGISKDETDFVVALCKRKKVVLSVFGNPYSLVRIKDTNPAALILAYEDMQATQELTAQIIFGGAKANGKLPVAVNSDFKKGEGLVTRASVRLKFTSPEDANARRDVLTKIDSIVAEAIKAKAFPGCQVVAVHDGKVFYNKSFGYFTYDSLHKVTNTDLYDLASLTKVCATAMSAMSLYDSKKIELDQPLSKYLPLLRKGNKDSLRVKEILAHQAGLIAWEPYYKRTLKDGKPDINIYDIIPSKKFSVPVAANLYMRNDYRDSLYKWINFSPLDKRGKYVYSDLGPILMKLATEKIIHSRFDSFLSTTFYKPLGLSTLGYLPLERFDSSRIAPTENDSSFRMQLIRGYVHDPAAAMQGGVSGNAGLFSSAADVAVLMQMLLNGGEYGGEKYLSAETIDRFTHQQFAGNRRGLLFDRPEIIPSAGSHTSTLVSQLSFGHQGFTGTYLWADPRSNLIYVFLSNRVYPDARNDKLAKQNIRTKIQTVIYESIK
jgi:beta-glucosidase-like glycosyl hydrolase/CubicO group peptidase (beta-lactamase class C family)